MPYATGPYATLTAAIAAPQDDITLHSSRKIDFATQEYVLNDEAGFEGMDDIAQRVILTVSYNVPRQTHISERDLRASELAVRNALEFMTGGPEPEIKLDKVSFARTSAGVTAGTVIFTNLLTGTKTSVVI